MATLTILQVVPRLDTGGSEQATVEIAEALTRANASALVATEGGRLATAVKSAGGEIVELPLASKNPVTMLANARRLARLIETRRIDLVHARSRAPAWSAFLAARPTRRPFVTTYHGAYSSKSPLKSLYNSIMARGDRVIANSLYTADFIVERHKVARDRLRIIYRGVDGGRFNPRSVSPEQVARLRERWGVAPDTKIVLLAARLSRIKGQRQAIEAAALLDRQGALDGAAMILAGDAPGKHAYREELAALIGGHGLKDKVRLVGHCSDMPAACLAAHVTLVPSLVPETFGRASIEAQAMGCPVVVSDLGALPETIVARERDEARFTGWLVPPGDVPALAEAIRRGLMLAPTERQEIGERARAHAGTSFELAQMQMKTLAVYDELLGSDLAGSLKRHARSKVSAP